MKLITFFTAFFIICSGSVQGTTTDEHVTVTKATVLQAGLKDNPTTVPVFCKVSNDSEKAVEAIIKQGNSVLSTQKLIKGNNDLFFFAQANKNRKVSNLELVVDSKKTKLKPITIPFRKWRVNFVPHGYWIYALPE